MSTKVTKQTLKSKKCECRKWSKILKFDIARNVPPPQTSSSNMSLRYLSPSMTFEYPLLRNIRLRKILLKNIPLRNILLKNILLRNILLGNILLRYILLRNILLRNLNICELLFRNFF